MPHFSQVYAQKGDPPEFTTRRVTSPMENMIISTEDIVEVLKNSKTGKSSGMDKTCPGLLKETMMTICTLLEIIFNKSLLTQKIPEEWKKAQISTVYKKGDKSQAGNYRSVSMTSIISKVMESLVRQHIISFMKDNKFFSEKQHGFISGRLTTLQLLEVLDMWTEAIGKGYEIDCTYMAFDTVHSDTGTQFC